MATARRIGTEDDEYGIEEEDEHDSLIELSTGRRGTKHPGGLDAPSSSSAGGLGTTCRWVTILFLFALAGVYRLGLQEGKNEVENENGVEDVEKKIPWHEKIIGINGGIGGGSGNEEVQTAPAPAAPKQGSFTLENLKATRDECEKIMMLLEEYYSGKDKAVNMLMKSWSDPWDFDAPEGAINKRLRNNKLVDTMARALVTDDQKKFLMGGIGSSVMAGHDNCHYDSYQSQMERLWSPVWEAAGMEFEFQNAGEGGGCGDSYANQIFCVKQNVSPDVDVVHYEWTYFEGGKATKEHESLIRWVQMLPKQPPLHILNTGAMPRNGMQDVELVDYYAKYGFNAFFINTGFVNGGHDYESEKKREKDPFDRFGWGFVGDGYHNTTRYGEVEDDEARKTSLGVVFRNWHPGPMAFQLTSDAFTYVYTRALLLALDVIEEIMDSGDDPNETWSASDRPLLLKNDLPKPKFCDPEYCVVDEAPGCLNYELPTFGYWGARVEDPLDDLNPHRGENQNWTVWHKNENLWYMVGKQDTAVFKNRDDKEICRHLDACGGISAQKAMDGMVVFRLPKMEVGLVVICGCCGKTVAKDMFINNKDIEISYNTVPIDRSTWDEWPNPKCVRLNQRFPTSGRESETPTGHAYLAIKVLKDMAQAIRISHVITL